MEENKNTNEELQSRREFFKRAAKAALPILGAVVLSSAAPQLLSAATPSSGCSSNCDKQCSGCGTSCFKGCSNGCSGGCTGCNGK